MKRERITGNLEKTKPKGFVCCKLKLLAKVKLQKDPKDT